MILHVKTPPPSKSMEVLSAVGFEDYPPDMMKLTFKALMYSFYIPAFQCIHL